MVTINLIATNNGLFHLFHTNLSSNNDYKDCLYSFTSYDDTNVWELVPYCIRHNSHSFDDVTNWCYEDEEYTFEKLKLKNVVSHQLYKWNAPIDTINDYQKYLDGNDPLLSKHSFCNCSGECTVYIVCSFSKM